eukprot:261186_1
MLSVVEGAAYFGIADNYIKARKLKYTYGESVYFTESKAKRLGISSEYILNNTREVDGKFWVKSCFKVIARQNEEIYTGQIKKNIGTRFSNTSKHAYTTILWSEMEFPKIRADGHKLDTLSTYFDNEDEDDMKVTT